jgi:23S rRNA pseudouridine1911/1915/1917 synthase
MSDLLIVAEEEAGLRLDKLLVGRFPECSRSYFQYLIENGSVLVNGKKIKKRDEPSPGDEIEICFILTPEISLDPQEIPLDILYEDEDFLAINKPAGMVVHPAPGHPSQTFVNALLFHCKQLQTQEGDLRPGIVHRLDKDTSGILLAAKTMEMHQQLVSLFCSRQIEKRYLAICIGNPGDRIINAPLGRHPIHRKEMAVLKSGGKESISRCRTLATHPPFSLVEITPLTGRTHQIRVHLKHVQSSILGDPVYGVASINLKEKAERQMLHAESLRFIHPRTKKLIELRAPPPKDFLKWMNIFSI